MLWVAQFPPSGPGGWQRHDQEALCWKNCWAQQAGRQTYNVMPLPVNFADWSVVVWPVGLQSSLSIFIVYCVLQVQDSDSKSSHYYAEVCCTQWIFYAVLQWLLHVHIDSNTVPSIAQAAEPQFSAENEVSTRPSSGYWCYTTAAGLSIPWHIRNIIRNQGFNFHLAKKKKVIHHILVYYRVNRFYK